MSPPSPETDTYEVTLSRREQWVVHHVLSTRLDDALEDDEEPPAWVLALLEALETGDGTEKLTGRQAGRLYDALTAYVDRDETPSDDVVHGSAVLDRLEDRLESH